MLRVVCLGAIEVPIVDAFLRVYQRSFRLVGAMRTWGRPTKIQIKVKLASRCRTTLFRESRAANRAINMTVSAQGFWSQKNIAASRPVSSTTVINNTQCAILSVLSVITALFGNGKARQKESVWIVS
jgi:hypothetical protein